MLFNLVNFCHFDWIKFTVDLCFSIRVSDLMKNPRRRIVFDSQSSVYICRLILSPMDMLVRKRSKERCFSRQPGRQLVQTFTLMGNKFDMI